MTVNARYRDDYFIAMKELAALIERVKEMQGIVGRICKEKLLRLHEKILGYVEEIILPRD